MRAELSRYGVKIVKRPKILATKKLDLSGEQGKQIIKSETKIAMRSHAKTLAKLADM